MYVRIARFEGGDMDEIEAEGALLCDGIAALRRGETTHELPPRLAQVTSRVEMLVDRKHGAVAVCVYSEREADMREADTILAGMTPANKGWGTRVSAEIYEVAVDETTAVSARV
jgi:pyruvoyl-dependent arginine decarboxylase (PvlArgDC)